MTLTLNLYLSLFFIALLFPTATTKAKLLNATIDDEYGDSLTGIKPIFRPATTGIWEGEECTGCRVKPDPAFTFNGTYNAATYRPEAGVNPISIRLSFNGTAVYVFFTLANNAGDNITTQTECNFTVDGSPPVYFKHEPDMNTTDFNYQALVFSRTGLEHAAHIVDVVTSGPDYHLFINFDYAIYTYDDTLLATKPSPSSSSQSQTSTSSTGAASATHSGSSGNKSATGAIAGGILGGLAILAIFILLLLYIRRRFNNGTLPIPPPLAGEFTDHGNPYMGVVQQNLSNVNISGSFPPSYFDQGGIYHSRSQSSTSLQRGPVPVFTKSRLPQASGKERSEGHHTDQPSTSSGLASLSYTSPSVASDPSYTNNRSAQPAVGAGVLLVPLRNTGAASSTSGSRSTSPNPSLPTEMQEAPTQRQTNLDSRIHTLQQAITGLIADLRTEQGVLTRRGVPEHQINASLETMRENLRMMAEQMATLQERRRNSAWTAAATDVVEEAPPGYDSPMAVRGRGSRVS